MTDLEAAVQLLGGETNKVIYDDIGLPSIMVRFDKKMISELVDDYVTDVVHPAFVVNNTELDNFYVSKYENIIINDRAYSLPLQESRITMISKAKEFCTNKGKGWHLFSVAEKAFIALQSFKNGINVGGNTRYGQNRIKDWEKGIKLDSGKVLTGSGPKSWAHNNDKSGVWDLVGNNGDWLNGIRFYNTELQIINNNDCADFNNSTDETSLLWKAIAPNGALLTPAGDGLTNNSIKYNYTGGIFKLDVNNLSDTGGSGVFSSMGSNVNVPQLLIILGLYPQKSKGYTYSGRFKVGASANKVCYTYSGGNYTAQTEAGLWALNNGLYDIAAHKCAIRSAYVEI